MSTAAFAYTVSTLPSMLREVPCTSAWCAALQHSIVAPVEQTVVGQTMPEHV